MTAKIVKRECIICENEFMIRTNRFLPSYEWDPLYITEQLHRYVCGDCRGKKWNVRVCY